MVDIFDIEIPSLVKGKTRRAFVYLPENYGNGRRFPVMYMFDGHNLFSDSDATYGKSWGLADYLDKTNTPLIIASVECNHEGNSRLSEYSPVDFTFKNGEKIKARGKKYMDWLVGSFKPMIDGKYPTLPDRAHTAVAGSSMGGLMTLYALSKYNKFFSSGAALSPSLWAFGTNLVSFLEGGTFKKDTCLYMDCGSKEFASRGTAKGNFCSAVEILIKKSVNLTARVVPDGTHTEASWERQIPFFMNALGFTSEIY